jgi:hypothetical protein
MDILPFSELSVSRRSEHDDPRLTDDQEQMSSMNPPHAGGEARDDVPLFQRGLAIPLPKKQSTERGYTRHGTARTLPGVIHRQENGGGRWIIVTGVDVVKKRDFH